MDIIKKIDTGKRINTDEIVRKIGDWRSAKDQMTAGRIAIEMRNECIKNGETFNQETTLTGKRILKTIESLKEQGYEINLYYVGVESAEIAKRRVKNRVEQGGHDIPEKIIEKRYEESLENLKKIISKCDNVALYDNSTLYERCLKKEGNKIEIPENSVMWTKEVINVLINNKNNTILNIKQKLKINTKNSIGINKIKIKAKTTVKKIKIMEMNFN